MPLLGCLNFLFRAKECISTRGFCLALRHVIMSVVSSTKPAPGAEGPSTAAALKGSATIEVNIRLRTVWAHEIQHLFNVLAGLIHVCLHWSLSVLHLLNFQLDFKSDFAL
jgi:hypothetical protein